MLQEFGKEKWLSKKNIVPNNESTVNEAEGGRPLGHFRFSSIGCCSSDDQIIAIETGLLSFHVSEIKDPRYYVEEEDQISQQQARPDV